MKLIATQTLTSPQTTITFNDIPQNFTDIVFRVSLRSTFSATTVSAGVILNSVASDTSYRGVVGNGSSKAGTTAVNTTDFYSFEVPGATATSGTFGNGEVYIPNYTSSNPKGLSSKGVAENNATAASLAMISGFCTKTAPVTSVIFRTFGQPSLTWAAGSTISLYGIGGVGDGYAAPKATGGVISYSGNYVIHTFTASGTFTPTANLTDVEYLVIAGGGGGGRSYYGAGGGAGGYRSSVTGESSGGGGSAESKLSLTSGTAYTVTVGAGGASFTNGVDSTFATITSVGGGRGGSENTSTAGGNGGSGGGSAFVAGTVGTGTANQGFAGGKGNDPAINNASGGGGGGAGSVGVASLAYVAGNGGNGVASSITGSAIARAGGGGGAGFGSNTYTQGVGQAGGGNGALDAANPGAANTGSGGGGRGRDTTGIAGGAGGSGVVIVRYAA